MGARPAASVARMFWTTAFLDLAPDDYDRAVAFWRGVTGYGRVAQPRRARRVRHPGPAGRRRPPEGPAPGGRAEPAARRPARRRPGRGGRRAEALGATVVTRHELGYVVMESPGGFTFCFVSHPASRAAAPADWGDGLTAAVDQVCLDVPEPAYETECRFWQAVTGWELRFSRELSEFRRLIRPARPAAAVPAPAARRAVRQRAAHTSTSPPATSRPRSHGTARSGPRSPTWVRAGRC